MPCGTSLLRRRSSLFADDFASDDAFRLIGEGVVVEEMLAGLRKLFQFFGQVVDSAVLYRRNRNDRLKRIQLRKFGNLRHQDRFVRQKINFVEARTAGICCCSKFFNQFQRRRGNLFPRFFHKQAGIYAGDRLQHGLDHIFAQTVARLQKAGRVNKDKLCFPLRQDAHDARTRRLRLVRNDGDFCCRAWRSGWRTSPRSGAPQLR